MRLRAVFLLLPGLGLLAGCVNEDAVAARPVMNAGWIDVTTDGGRQMLQKLLVRHEGYPVAPEVDNASNDCLPHRNRKSKARVLWDAGLSGREWMVRYMVATYDSGRGTADPLVCLYEVHSSTGVLRWVWHERVKSIYGFNWAEGVPGGVKLRSDFPEANGPKGHTSTVMMLPRNVEAPKEFGGPV